MMWFRYNSYLIGGMQNWNPRVRDLGVVRSVYQTFYKTDLEKFNKSHSVINPKVSLFNLADDPEEAPPAPPNLFCATGLTTALANAL